MKKLVTILLLLALLAIPMTAMAKGKGDAWYVPGDYATIQEAIDSAAVMARDTIFVGPGNHAGALVTKAVKIKGQDGAVIDSGPMHPAGLSQGFRLMAGSSGTEISHLQFEVDLAIMNGAAADDVVVTHNTFINAVQAVSNWSGSRWTISHNVMIDLRCRNGGGIGILVADRFGGIVADNLIEHNKISGTLHVDPSDQGGYQGSGVVIYADFRWGMAGAAEIRNNFVTQNKVSLISDTPAVVDVVAFELTDTRDDTNADPFPVLFDNAIGFNDFRGTATQIVLTPEVLADFNSIDRNFGDIRGQGLHPSVFKP